MNDRDHGQKPRRYYSEQGRNYIPHNIPGNPDVRYDQRKRNNYRPNYHDPYYPQPRYQDGPKDGQYPPYRRYEKENFRYQQRFDSRRQLPQEDKPFPNERRHDSYQQMPKEQPKQFVNTYQSKPPLNNSSEDPLAGKIEGAIFLITEQKKANQVIGLYQAPTHKLHEQWD